MNKELKHSIYHPQDCIPEQMMFDYIDNKLSPKEQHLVEKHMLDCEFCSDALEGLRLLKNRERIAELNNEVKSKLASPTPKTGNDIRFILSIAAGVLLLIGAIFMFNQFTKHEDLAELKTDVSKEAEPSKAGEQFTGDTAASTSTTIPVKEKMGIPEAAEQNNNRKIEDKEIDEPKQEQSFSAITNEVAADEIAVTESKNAEKHDLDKKREDEQQDKDRSSITQTVSGNSAPQATATGMINDDNTIADNRKLSKEETVQNDEYLENQVLSKSAKKNESRTPEKKKTEDQKSRSEKAGAQAGYDLAENQNSVSYTWQTDSTVKPNVQVYTIADEMPEFPGGQEALESFIRKSGNFELSRLANDSKNIVSVQFIISSEGKALQAKIITPVDKDTESKIIKLVKEMPVWKPGRLNNKNVSVFYNLSLRIIN